MPPVFLICGYFSCNSHFKFYSVASSFSKFTLFHYRNAHYYHKLDSVVILLSLLVIRTNINEITDMNRPTAAE